MNLIKNSSELIICPKCNGTGKINHLKRVSWNEEEYWETKCEYCKGKRVIKRRTVIEDYEVEDLRIIEEVKRI